MVESNTETKSFWDFYNKCISDDGARRAQCTICKNVYNYTSTVYNLKAHLFNIHNDVIGDMDVDFGGHQMKRIRVKKEKMNVWEHFSSLEDEDKLAECNHCNKLVSYKSTTANLRNHLSRVHPVVGSKAFKDQKDETSEDDAPVVYGDMDVDFGGTPMKNSKVNRRTSKIWEHFTALEDEDKIAECNHCKKRLSFKSTTANLRIHLSRSHPVMFANAFIKHPEDETSEDDASVPHDDESEDATKGCDCTVMGREPNGRSRCLMCGKRGPDHPANVEKHREQLPKQENQDSDVHIQNDDEDDQETYTEVVYLEDSNLLETNNYEKKKWLNEKNAKKVRLDDTAPKSLRKRKQMHKRPQYRRASTSSDEPIIKKSKANDEIRKFGEYVICLLQKLPRDLCMKMQMNIINMIVNANLASTEAENIPVAQPVPANVAVVQPPATVTGPVPENVPVVQAVPDGKTVSGKVSIVQSQTVPGQYYVIAKSEIDKSLLQNTSTETEPIQSAVVGNHSYSTSYIIATSPPATTTVAQNGATD